MFRGLGFDGQPHSQTDFPLYKRRRVIAKHSDSGVRRSISGYRCHFPYTGAGGPTRPRHKASQSSAWVPTRHTAPPSSRKRGGSRTEAWEQASVQSQWLKGFFPSPVLAPVLIANGQSCEASVPALHGPGSLLALNLWARCPAWCARGPPGSSFTCRVPGPPSQRLVQQAVPGICLSPCACLGFSSSRHVGLRPGSSAPQTTLHADNLVPCPGRQMGFRVSRGIRKNSAVSLLQPYVAA